MLQFLWLMYLFSKDQSFLRVPNRVTRNAAKISSTVPTRIMPIFENSPFFIGTKLLNDLSIDIQDATDIFAFKKCISSLNRVYKKL